ncbi:dihydropteroate synthase [Rhodovulum sp. DZ06]|uniref:dihydropteroate synthase n=1 Tax=Rhodovulum sp. DZ06 TaxID=3425126 RepID=UPI003D337569
MHDPTPLCVPDGASLLHRPDRPLLMAVLNVTPDSFSDGGRYITPEAALAQGRRLAAEGADILDIGGESTRPGAEPVPEAEEIARVVPVIRALAAELSIPISIDTFKAATAEAALEAGARIVNDVWGFQRETRIAEVAARAGAHAVLMHNRPHDAPPCGDIEDEIRAFLSRSLEIAEAAGVPRSRLALDPGVGFGKSMAQNAALCADPGFLRRAFGLPVLIGASRKRLIASLIGDAGKDRDAGTLALHAIAAMEGADVIRAHDAAAHADAMRVAAGLRAARAAGIGAAPGSAP